MKRILLSISTIMFVGTSMAQWYNNQLLNGGGNNLGTSSSYNAPINIFTNGIFRAQFTTGGALGSWMNNFGDGLRILPPPGQSGSLDLFTSNNNGGSETHAVFGGSGQISGQNNRFEFISTGATMGNYYSTFSATGIHRFDRGTAEQGRLGTNNNWRFGANTSGQVFGGLNAARKVEVVDNNVQFRLTYSANASGPNTDFYSNQQGNLQIMPTGQRVGINLNSNPTANLDINGDARIRNVQTGTPNSILVGVN
jgi:hypothetical protein